MGAKPRQETELEARRAKIKICVSVLCSFPYTGSKAGRGNNWLKEATTKK